MSFEGWLIFATFWVVFVTTPGPNAVNCLSNGMTLGFRKSLIGVLAIMTQATIFLILSAFGVTALIAASEVGFAIAKWLGAGFLIYIGVRGWMRAATPHPSMPLPAASVYWRAFVIATVNPKSVAGYLAAFSQFVQPDVPIWDQMFVIIPTALTITAMSYLGFTVLGVGMGYAALGVVFNRWVRRIMSGCFVIYGILLGNATLAGRA
ncbi:MAG: LysE family transporter [Pseudomonadota bacterium]